MYRMLYRVGLLLGAAILAIFIGARLINLFDPYRIVTEDLIADLSADPERTDRLHQYGTISSQLRQTLYTEEATRWVGWLDQTKVLKVVEAIPFRTKVGLFIRGADVAVHKIAEFDSTLSNLTAAETLAQDMVQLRYYDMDRGEEVLARLYSQSTAVSHSLSDVSRGMDEVATAVSAVTELPALETIQQEVGGWRDSFSNIASSGGNLLLGPDLANDLGQVADFVYWSIESWQGVPGNMQTSRHQIETDVAWLDAFEQQFDWAKAFNDRWHFATLRHLPRFANEFQQPLLLGVIGSLLLAIVGWIGSTQPARLSQPRLVAPAAEPEPLPKPPERSPVLDFCWPDGRCEQQSLPSVGELTIGNIVIRRARVRYYLERIDNAFPAFLNGQSICGARLLQDGDVLQVGELKTVFQFSAS